MRWQHRILTRLKAHIGVDAESGLVHTVVGTAANVADINETTNVLHGEEKTVHLDAGYTGIEKRDEVKDVKVAWQVAVKRGKIKALPEGSKLRDLVELMERAKARIRARVEHAFHVLKNLFHYKKVRYKGLAKNTAQLHTLFGLVNLVIAKRQLLALHAQGAS
jgi:IS5 family transposase